MGKGFMDFFNEASPDFFCVQETKMQREQSEFDFGHRLEFWNDAVKKGYSGTAIFTAMEPLSASYGMGIDRHDTEGRIIMLEYETFFLVDVYTPNSQHELPRLPYRMEWEDDFRAYVKTLDAKKPVIICGDLNVAHTEMDIKNAKSNVKNPGFTPQEREKMTILLENGWADTFRFLYPDKRDAYTWWSFMGNARSRNVGWRIDYFLVSKRAETGIMEAEIFDQVYGSDHCPVGLTINI
ncbi:MAG: exodeoxyribonuclease III [Defluviitaleaceae bacterium]|nr:exodeoxyribonuclease III [Defluviitaleaceae bacterium]